MGFPDEYESLGNYLMKAERALQAAQDERFTSVHETLTSFPSFSASRCSLPLPSALTKAPIRRSRSDRDAYHGVKLMPHRHRVYTVISGVFYIGLGDQFDAEKLQAYPPGSVIVLPGDTPHFHWAKSSEYVTQVTAIRPLGLECLSARDDPRSNHS
jgi:hypothetical protein